MIIDEMKLSLAVIIIMLATLAARTYGKAGKPCKRRIDCHSGLQVCNRQGMCECFVAGRRSHRIMRLLDVCRADTHQSKVNERCIYSSQCTWLGTDIGCRNGICSTCEPGFRFADDINCVRVSTTTTTTKAPLTKEEKDEQRKGVVHKIIVIAAGICCSLAALAICVALIRLKCGEKRRRKRYPEQIYFQGNQTRLQDEQSAFSSAPALDYVGPKDPVEASAPILPEYSEGFSESHAQEKANPPEIKDLNVTKHEEPLSVPTAPSPNQWDRWFPPIEEHYHSRGDEPPPYDLNKHFKKPNSRSTSPS